MHCNQLVVIPDIHILSFVLASTSCVCLFCVTESSYRVFIQFFSLYTASLSRLTRSNCCSTPVVFLLLLCQPLFGCLSSMPVRATESQLLKHVTDSVQPQTKTQVSDTAHMIRHHYTDITGTHRQTSHTLHRCTETDT